MNKAKNSLVLKFLESMNHRWEHHVDVLKNSKKIATMDLTSLFGNIHNPKKQKF